jgi:Ala-tRNA(Pro) deacylase
MEKEVLELLEFFKREGVEYRLYRHGPVYTSEQASRARGVDLRTGVKALLLKAGEKGFLLADIAANLKVDLRKLERLAKAGRIRLATREEVLSVTNCEPGSVHPFGGMFGLPTYLDYSVLENEFVNFNVGVLTESVQIKSADLERLARPTLGDFGKEERDENGSAAVPSV